jgi:peptidoglycan/xylan/chitin deacetylase (PgdA/CDA1 family)
MIKHFISITGQKTIFPVYHTVSEHSLPHLRHLYAVKTPRQFEQDLDFILKYFDPMTIQDVMAYCKNGKKSSKPSFFLSFDDGLREVYEIIYPILKKKGISAAIFLNSAFVDNKAMFYRFKVSLLLNEIENSPDCIRHQDVIRWAKMNQITDLAPWLKKAQYHQQHLLDQLALLIDVSFENYLIHNQPYMTSSQISQLYHDGFYIGGHSVDHPKYDEVQLDEQIRQTNQSIEWVQDRWPQEVNFFAFPFSDYGVKASFFKQVATAISFGTAGLKNDPVKTHIQRIPMEINHFSAPYIIRKQYLYYMAKALILKNTIRRND